MKKFNIEIDERYLYLLMGIAIEEKEKAEKANHLHDYMLYTDMLNKVYSQVAAQGGPSEEMREVQKKRDAGVNEGYFSTPT